MSGKNPEKETKTTGIITLGALRYTLETDELTDGSGQPVHLRSQSSKVLAYLARQRGQTVSKSELFENVWDKSFVTDDSLVQCIADIRRALGEDGHKIVQTLPNKGYRLNTAPIADRGRTQPAPRQKPAVWIAALALILAIGAALFWTTKDKRAALDPASMDLPLPSRPSIAVLAFEDHSIGSDTNYLSDAIAEGIIADLSRFTELFVIARNSSFSFRDRPTDVKDISRTLGVRYLLEGSQQKSGDRLRVTVQLIDAVEGHHLWSDVYERDLSDVFAMQDDIVRKIVATVAQKVINSEGKKAITSDASTLTALLHNLKARQHLFDFTPEGNEKARLANLAAVKADPTAPYGYVGLTFVHINRYRWGWTDGELIDELRTAQASARKAVELAPDYYDAHAAMAYVHIQEGKLDKAVARFRKALELNPNDTSAMANLAEALTYGGDAESAEELMLKVTRLDPLHEDWIKWNLAWVQWHTGNCDAGVETMNGMSDIPPMAYRVLALLQVCRGAINEARDAVQHIMDFDPTYSLDKVHHNYHGKYSNVADLERVMDSLRQAGLPN